MYGLMKRHDVQVLRRAGHKQREVADSGRTVRRVEAEDPVEGGIVDDATERSRRRVGRPSR